MNKLNVLIISEDVVFVSILKRFMLNYWHDIVFETQHSYSGVKSIPLKYQIDLVLVDDSITGTADFEVISHLRYEKMIKAPVYYFSHADSEDNALIKGANYTCLIPFDPYEVIKHIKSVIGNKNEIQNV